MTMTRRAWAMTLAATALIATPIWAETARPKARPVVMAASATNAPPETRTNRLQDSAEAVRTPTPAAKGAAPVPARDPNRGAVTNLPLPRYVSLKTGEGNARRGPGLTHRIDWVFTRAGMPLKITAEHEHWRRVEDAEGVGGWVHFALLSGVRSVLVAGERVDFHTRADVDAPVEFQAEAGVVAKVIECAHGWCRVSVDGSKGWVQTTSLWGVEGDEVIE